MRATGECSCYNVPGKYERLYSAHLQINRTRPLEAVIFSASALDVLRARYRFSSEWQRYIEARQAPLGRSPWKAAWQHITRIAPLE